MLPMEVYLYKAFGFLGHVVTQSRFPMESAFGGQTSVLLPTLLDSDYAAPLAVSILKINI